MNLVQVQSVGPVSGAGEVSKGWGPGPRRPSFCMPHSSDCRPLFCFCFFVLKQTIIILQSCRLETYSGPHWLTPRCQLCSLLKTREESVSLPCPASGSCPHSLALRSLPSVSKPSTGHQEFLTWHHPGLLSRLPLLL